MLSPASAMMTVWMRGRWLFGNLCTRMALKKLGIFLAQDMIALQNEPENSLHYSAEALAYVEHTACRILLDATAQNRADDGILPVSLGPGTHRKS